MTAALKAWGSERNLFHQGFAQETDDPAVVEATMTHPGVVLKRAVGSKGMYSEQAELPKSLPAQRPKRAPLAKSKKRPAKVQKSKATARVLSLADARAAKQAAARFEKAQAQREAEEHRMEAARERDRERRQKVIDKAEAALGKARRAHDQGSRRSRANARPSKGERRLRTHAGIKKKRSLSKLFGAQETIDPSGTHRPPIDEVLEAGRTPRIPIRSRLRTEPRTARPPPAV